MKQIFSLALSCLTCVLVAQSPQTISYQAILRDNLGVLIQDENNVGVLVTILQGSLIENNVVYMEDHTTSTNANGLFTIEIGNGVAASGNYPSIEWGAGPFFLKTEIDPLGGTNYLITAISELLSVPFANYANQAGRHPGLAGLLEGHWVPVEDNLGIGTIFFQYISQTAVTIMYTFMNSDGFLELGTELWLVQGSSFVSLDGLPIGTFSVNATQLTLTVNGVGVTTFERQF
jgi:hypothetical protein